MENLIKQTRVRFPGPEQKEYSSFRDSTVATRQRESFRRDNEGQNWFQRQFYRQMMMSQDYDFQDGELATAVAAATFAIHSLEEAEADYRRRLREDSADGSVRVTRRLSSREVQVTGESSAGKSIEDRKLQENAFPSRKPSRSSSMRPMNLSDQKLKGNSSVINVMETKADSWQKAQLRKISKRYEKTKSEIVEWENAKKMEAKLRMEKKKNELELRKARNLQHYQNKLARIDLIAGGARTQLDERRRNEESEVKRKAKYMGTKGRSSPLNCFCW